MTKRRFIIASTFVVGLALTVFYVTRQPGAVARSRRVQLGMSIAEVREIMGMVGTFEGPEFNGRQVSGRFILAGYDEGLVNKFGRFAQDNLGAKGLLTDSSTSVLILFDAEGRVIEITRGEEPPIKAVVEP